MFFNKKNLLALLLVISVIASVFCLGAAAEDTTVADTVAEELTTVEDATGADTAAEEETTAATTEKTDKTGLIVGLIITAVIVGIGVAFAIVKRASIGPFFRSVASERKKVVWSSHKDTRKNTLVVIVIVVILALIIFALDTAFTEGIQFAGQKLGNLASEDTTAEETTTAVEATTAAEEATTAAEEATTVDEATTVTDETTVEEDTSASAGINYQFINF